MQNYLTVLMLRMMLTGSEKMAMDSPLVSPKLITATESLWHQLNGPSPLIVLFQKGLPGSSKVHN